MDVASTDQDCYRPAESHEQRGGASSLFLWTLVAFIIYVLSIGPAAKLDDKFNFHRDNPALDHALAILYAPIMWTAAQLPSVDRCLEWCFRKLWHIN